MHAAVGKLDQVLLQRLYAEDVLDLEILHPPVGAVGVNEKLLAAAEEPRGQSKFGGDFPGVFQPANRPGDPLLGLGHVGRPNRLGGVDDLGRLRRIRFRHAAEDPCRKLRFGVVQGGCPGQVLRLLKHDAEMVVGQFADVLKGDMRKLAVMEITQHGLRRGMVHCPIVVRPSPEPGLFLVTSDALLPADVLGLFALGHTDPPVGSQQHGPRGQQYQQQEK